MPGSGTYNFSVIFVFIPRFIPYLSLISDSEGRVEIMNPKNSDFITLELFGVLCSLVGEGGDETRN